LRKTTGKSPRLDQRLAGQPFLPQDRGFPLDLVSLD